MGVVTHALLGICLYTYHKYRTSIDSQVPLDLHGNPVSDEDPEGGGVALDLGYIHENVRYTTEEAQPLASSNPLSSDGQRAHNAVRALCSMTCHYIKLNYHLSHAGPPQCGR
jgi:solute carrier family 35 protein C2